MKILILTMGYPSNRNKSRLIFLQRLVNEFTDMGNECTVIAPSKRFRNEGSNDYMECQKTSAGKEVKVYFPKYNCIWLTSRVKKDLFRKYSISEYIKSVKKVIDKAKIEFDCIYSHFVGVSAFAAVEIGKEFDVPAFAAAGESVFIDFEGIDREYTINKLNQLDGIVSVSSENKQLLLSNKVLNDKLIQVFPNGINTDIFYPREQSKSREKFGFPQDEFIVCFIGHFIERKGPLRLAEAVRDLNVKVAFAGSGEQTPSIPNMIYCETVSPSDMPEFLSASNVFVLPTLNEGCCNSIIEAMACGLPVISSNLPFNDDILDDKCSIKIDPNSIDEIRDAILFMYSNKDIYENFKLYATEKGAQLNLKNRAKNILLWIEEVMR